MGIPTACLVTPMLQARQVRCRAIPDHRSALRPSDALFEGDRLPNPEAAMPKLTYSVPEVAEILGICRTTAYECVRRGEIPALILGRRILVTRAALEQLLGPIPETAAPSARDAS
jgi:excisionase family DNA binding protein